MKRQPTEGEKIFANDATDNIQTTQTSQQQKNKQANQKMGRRHKSTHRTMTWPINLILGHISGQNVPWKRHMHPYVHCSTIHDSHDMETT